MHVAYRYSPAGRAPPSRTEGLDVHDGPTLYGLSYAFPLSLRLPERYCSYPPRSRRPWPL